MMFYAKFESHGKEKSALYFDWEEYMVDTFDPNTKPISFIQFNVIGKDYQSRKNHVRNIAVDWSNHADVGDLYMSDLWHISDWFYRNGKRYGLLEEFRENGLC